MSGYYEFSKSNNAVEAELNGRFPASILAKQLGVKPAAVKAVLSPCEWHHTSKHYNVTNYYSSEDAEARLDELKAWREPSGNVETFENCSGSYLEWSGTRNHPKAREISFGPVTVSKKGKWFTLNLPSGPIRKGEDTRGFHLFDAQKKRLTFNR